MKRIPARRRSKMSIVVLGWLWVMAASSSAETALTPALNNTQAHSRAWVDWQGKKLHIELSAPIDTVNVRNRSSLIARKETELKNLFPSYFPVFLQEIRLDASRRFIDLLSNDSTLNLTARSLSDQALLVRSQPSADLKSLTLEYLFPLTPQLSGLLIDFQQPIELERILDWHPRADYTGVVIHVETALPWYGSDHDVELRAALFPRILDEDSRVVLDAARMLPIAAKRWSTVGYVTGPHPERDTERVGDHPLITTARAIFGTTPTDVMISREDADLLLYNESTRRALQEGKILIVVKEAAMQEEIVRR